MQTHFQIPPLKKLTSKKVKKLTSKKVKKLTSKKVKKLTSKKENISAQPQRFSEPV
jgi:hypothetical protein